jgi:uncharacterized membrane protein YsdA (DUF1294 family)
MVLVVYLAAINLLAFVMYGIDKRKAIKGARRIPEKTLILLAVLGGAIGAFIGMHVFHHKTKKPKFFIGVPVILVVQIALTVILLRKH